ncbi:hypothetical protein Tco_1210528 [Tanacetum coccineum]
MMSLPDHRGYVTFGGGVKGGKITGKGTLKTSKLDFEDVYFVKELQFNLFSVSQMCDKKNSIILSKFDGKSDEGFFVGYSMNSKAFRVYNIRTRKVEENLHIRFLEDKPIIAGDGPKSLVTDIAQKDKNKAKMDKTEHGNGMSAKIKAEGVPILMGRHAFREKQHQLEDIQELIHKLLKDLQIISEELAEYINSPSWNCPAFYDDDDEYNIQYKEYLENSSNAIRPDLSTEDPNNSLSMGDEHPSTILETESDEVIKSSVKDLVNPIEDDYFEDIDYIKASPPDSELVSLEEVKDDILCEKLLNINLLIAKIESLNNNPTPDYVLKSPSPFPILVEDSDSLPEFKTFSDHTEEMSSGSTNTHFDNSIPEYDSFLFNIEPGQGELTSVVMEDILGEPRVHVPNVYPPIPPL